MAYLRFDSAAMERVHRESECGIVEEKREKDSVVVTFVTCSFDWLAGWILSFGKSAEVLAPKELRDRVAGEAKKILHLYATGAESRGTSARMNASSHAAAL